LLQRNIAYGNAHNVNQTPSMETFMPAKKSDLNEEQIRQIAYTLWLNEGRPEGSAEIHWFRAVELAAAKPAKKAAVKKAA
jgi:hypothetical protein